MRCSLALISAFALFGAIRGEADDALPARFNFDRYSAMVDHSPFAIATAVALPAATPNFAKDLYVANAARAPEGDMVTLASSSDQNFKKYLTTREAVDGYTIAGIEWSDRVGATKVTVSKDGQFATLTFNQALLSQRASANPARAPGQMPQSASLKSSYVPRQAPYAGAPNMTKSQPKAGAVPAANLASPQTSNSEQEQQRQRLQQLQQSRVLTEHLLKQRANAERP
jgi:hypothetical protein